MNRTAERRSARSAADQNGKIVILVGADEKSRKLLDDSVALPDEVLSWSAPKGTKAGDTLLIYAQQPVSSIVATAKALNNAEPSDEWPYCVKIGSLHVLKQPITLAEIRKGCPEWGWAKHPQSNTYLRPGVDQRGAMVVEVDVLKNYSAGQWRKCHKRRWFWMR